MEHELRWLRTYVIQSMEEAFGEAPEVDEAGDVAVRQGTAACYVNCHDAGFPVVRVWAIAAMRLRSRGRLLREINDVGQAFLAVAGVANDIGSLMAITFGGDTPYPADAEEVDARDEAA